MSVGSGMPESLREERVPELRSNQHTRDRRGWSGWYVES